MASQVNMHEAKTHLSRLVDQAVQGEEIIIAKAGKPLVKLAPVEQSREARRPGSMRGRIRLAPDFDAVLPEDVLREFHADV
jgi:prevent-host-death family protein